MSKNDVEDLLLFVLGVNGMDLIPYLINDANILMCFAVILTIYIITRLIFKYIE